VFSFSARWKSQAGPKFFCPDALPSFHTLLASGIVSDADLYFVFSAFIVLIDKADMGLSLFRGSQPRVGLSRHQSGCDARSCENDMIDITSILGIYNSLWVDLLGSRSFHKLLYSLVAVHQNKLPRGVNSRKMTRRISLLFSKALAAPIRI